jgi:hypothetical protein
VSTLDRTTPTGAERRWLLVGLVAAFFLLVAQLVGGTVRTAVTHQPSALERVETCLRERSTPYEAVAGDPVAESAGHGTLRTTVQGNALTVALGSSESDAHRIYDDYTSVMTSADQSLLDLHRRVVFLWAKAPTQSQRDFAYLCTLDVQD